MKRNSRMFIVLFAFFIVVAFGALFMLSGKSSVFNRDSNSIGAQTAVMSKTVVGDEPTEDISLPNEILDAATEATSEEVVEVAAATEATSKEEEDDKDAASDPKRIRYFKFRTSTTHTVLNFRKEPSEDSTVLYKLAKQTPGYILQPGNTWCKVALETGQIGYCATEYLDRTEVQKSDFPEEFADLVEAPEEALTY